MIQNKWIFIKDKSDTIPDYDLFTYKFQNMYIQKLRCETEYAVWVKLFDTGHILKDFKFIGVFKTLRHSKYIAETYYKENL